MRIDDSAGGKTFFSICRSGERGESVRKTGIFMEIPAERPQPREDSSVKSEDTHAKSVHEHPPPNLLGGDTLIVDGADPTCYPRPSLAYNDARSIDQVFIRPGIYEDRLFVSDTPIHLIGAGRDRVQIFSRRSGPLYLQRVPKGHISGITFRYVGSDQHSPLNILDSVCTISHCRITEGILSGVVIYGPHCRPTLIYNEICGNRESGIFAFAGAHPYVSHNVSFANHHFGLAARDDGTCPDFVKNQCRDNMLSGILLFHLAQALVLDNSCQGNCHWGFVATPDCKTTPEFEQLAAANMLEPNLRGAMMITHEPLAEIGR